jgi:hypothetical protein
MGRGAHLGALHGRRVLAPVLLWCLVRSPSTVLLLVAVAAAMISRG